MAVVLEYSEIKVCQGKQKHAHLKAMYSISVYEWFVYDIFFIFSVNKWTSITEDKPHLHVNSV